MSKLRTPSVAKVHSALAAILLPAVRVSLALKAFQSSSAEHRVAEVVVVLETFSRSLRKCLAESSRREEPKRKLRAKTLL